MPGSGPRLVTGTQTQPLKTSRVRWSLPGTHMGKPSRGGAAAPGASREVGFPARPPVQVPEASGLGKKHCFYIIRGLAPSGLVWLQTGSWARKAVLSQARYGHRTWVRFLICREEQPLTSLFPDRSPIKVMGIHRKTKRPSISDRILALTFPLGGNLNTDPV